MLKKLIQVLKRFIIVVCVIAVSIGIFIQIKRNEYEDKAVPFIEDNIRNFVSWNAENIKPLMAKKGVVEFDFQPENIQAGLNYISKVGEFDVYQEPKFVNTRFGFNDENGLFQLATFIVPLYFSNGDGDVTITVIKHDESYKITHLKYYAAPDS